MGTGALQKHLHMARLFVCLQKMPIKAAHMHHTCCPLCTLPCGRQMHMLPYVHTSKQQANAHAVLWTHFKQQAHTHAALRAHTSKQQARTHPAQLLFRSTSPNYTNHPITPLAGMHTLAGEKCYCYCCCRRHTGYTSQLAPLQVPSSCCTRPTPCLRGCLLLHPQLDTTLLPQMPLVHSSAAQTQQHIVLHTSSMQLLLAALSAAGCMLAAACTR